MKDSKFIKCNCGGHGVPVEAMKDFVDSKESDIIIDFWYSSKIDEYSIWRRIKKLVKFVFKGEPIDGFDMIISPEKAKILADELYSSLNYVREERDDGDS